MKSVLLSIFLLLNSIFALPQDCCQYGISNGLSSEEVTAVCKNENYYWIATTDGLCRFDGHNYKIYRRTNDKKAGLSSNNIETLHMDSRGRLWIGYKTRGVDIFLPAEEKFIPLSSIVKASLPHRVVSIFEDSQRTIWLGSWEDGVYQLIPDKSTFKVVNHYPGLIVSSFLEKPSGLLWIGTYNGGLLYEMKANKWKSFGAGQTITSIKSDKNDIYYSTWSNGIKKLTFSFRKHLTDLYETDFYNSSFAISKMVILPDHSFLAGTWGNGLKRVGNKNGHHLSAILPSNTKNIYVDDLFLDSNGSVWISTYGNGLIKYKPDIPVIKKLPVTFRGQSPVSVIYKLPGNEILVGTRGEGSFICNWKSAQLSSFLPALKGMENPYLLTGNLSDNVLVLGHDGVGLFYHPDYGTKGNYSGRLHSCCKEIGKITSIYNQGSQYWIGTKQYGFYTASYNSKTKEFGNIRLHEEVGRDEITGIVPFSKNKLWISSHNGLHLYNWQADSTESYAGDEIREAVYCILNDYPERRLWAGTSSGIFCIDSRTRKIRQVIGNESILPPGAVKTLKADRKKTLWFTVSNRLFYYKTRSSEFGEINMGRNIKSPILSSEIINDNKNEYLLLGSSEGITSLDLGRIYTIPDKKRILLTDLSIDLKRIQVGEKVHGTVPLQKSTEYLSETELSYKCKWISLFFTEIGENLLRNQYQYRIEGFSNTWKNFDIENPITLSQLPAGDYNLEIRKYTGTLKAANVLWSMKLSVIPPFWQTTWFRSFFLLLLLFSMVVTVLLYMRNYRRKMAARFRAVKKEKELELLKDKESFFMGLSHDILTPFMLILSPAKDLLSDNTIPEDNKEKVRVIFKNASFLSDIFSAILEFKQAETLGNTLTVKEFELISFSKIIIDSFRYLAQSKSISLSFRSNVDILRVKTDNVKLERILYNLLSNALKYTPNGGKVSVSLLFTGEAIEIEVMDNGYGIATENKDRIFEKFYQEKRDGYNGKNGFGLGLYIVKKFVSALDGRIKLNETDSAGTSVSVFLPQKLLCGQENEFCLSEDLKSQIEDTSETLKPLILLVEDNDDLRNYLKEKLSRKFSVIAASNGFEALSLAKETIPEIIISDLMMPEMDGLSLCQKIKESELLADIFFVMLTAKNSSDDEIESYKDGVDIFIRKPVEADSLISQISNILTTRLNQRRQIIQKLMLQKGEICNFNPRDAFLKEVMRIIEENIINPDFKIDDLAQKMHLSKTVLHRKFKELLDETPSQFIRNIRLKKAENLLLNSDYTISEIAYLTGFNLPHYFIKCFRELFHDTPKNYRSKNRGGVEVGN